VLSFALAPSSSWEPGDPPAAQRRRAFRSSAPEGRSNGSRTTPRCPGEEATYRLPPITQRSDAIRVLRRRESPRGGAPVRRGPRPEAHAEPTGCPPLLERTGRLDSPRPQSYSGVLGGRGWVRLGAFPRLCRAGVGHRRDRLAGASCTAIAGAGYWRLGCGPWCKRPPLVSKGIFAAQEGPASGPPDAGPSCCPATSRQPSGGQRRRCLG
jgi:hypothetical protein